jgi:cold shock CspA family protein
LSREEEDLAQGIEREGGMERQPGRVVQWVPERGFGFIESAGETYFFHRTYMADSRFEDARPGTRVSFEPYVDAQGRLRAFGVRLEVVGGHGEPVAPTVTPPSGALTDAPAFTAELPRVDVPQTVDVVVRQHVEALPPGGVVTVDEIVRGTGLPRNAVVRQLQSCEEAGVGRFIAGRRGHPSRFQKALPMFPRAA